MSKGVLALALLSAAQFALLVLIYTNNSMVSREASTDLIALPANSVQVLGSSPDEENETRASIAGISEHKLRQIIQDELQNYLGDRSQLVERDLETSPDHSMIQSEVERHRSHVFRQVDYYTSVGSISDQQMAQLQMDIAKLDKSGRKEILSRIVRAINAGELDAQF